MSKLPNSWVYKNKKPRELSFYTEYIRDPNMPVIFVEYISENHDSKNNTILLIKGKEEIQSLKEWLNKNYP
jgi:hypothetical protein